MVVAYSYPKRSAERFSCGIILAFMSRDAHSLRVMSMTGTDSELSFLITLSRKRQQGGNCG
jgi:hypothetical protein